MLAIGRYPTVTLSKAREKAEAARVLLADGKSPTETKRAERSGDTFKAVAASWLATQKLAPNTTERTEHIFERWVFPRIGARPVVSLRLADVSDAVAAIGEAGKHETARRALQRISSVLRYARVRGMVPENVAADIKPADLLGARRAPRHHAAITDPVRFGELLRAIDGYTGAGVTLYALKLAPLLFVRPGELRSAEWSEFTLDGPTPQWAIPAAKMKMRQAHIVPLARQAVAILRGLHSLTGAGRYLFPATVGRDRCMSENTLTTALLRLGYQRGDVTAHGFRSTASTLLNTGWGQHRFNRDHIELQLAHSEANEVRAAYNHAEHLPERRAMMQAYADYLDTLRAAPAKAAA
jgi:integrase